MKKFIPISSSHPLLAAQALGWNPDNVSAGSNVKVTWKCNSGHTWKASPNKRAGRGDGCPICSGRLVVVGVNDLATTHPELATEANGWNPESFSAGSNKKVEWRCKIGHTWETTVFHRTGSIKTGCPVCSGKKIVSGQNDLKTKFPAIARQAKGWDPSLISPGSNKKVLWICSFGHEWIAQVSSRTSQGTDCPICSNKKILPGTNDLATLYPNLAAEAYCWDPTLVGAGSAKKLDWICPKGHIFRTSVVKRTKRNQGCPVCANKQVIAGINDLFTTHPEIAREAYGWDPTTVNAGRGSKNATREKRIWKCSSGHIYEATPSSRTRSGTGCPYCSGNTNLPGFNDLATTHPNLAEEADGWNPSESRGNHKKVQKWICPLGHRYKASITARISGSNCPYCSGKRILIGFNDLATLNPDLAMQAYGWDPSTVQPHSNKKKEWRCVDGHIWATSPNNRSQGKGCPGCAVSGFNPSEKGYLYFLTHRDLNLFQIGITNFPEDRINKHKRSGWEAIDIRGPMEGQLARDWELAILDYVKANGGKMANDLDINPFDGYTEAWLQTSFPLNSIKEIMDIIDEQERKGFR